MTSLITCDEYLDIEYDTGLLGYQKIFATADQFCAKHIKTDNPIDLPKIDWARKFKVTYTPNPKRNRTDNSSALIEFIVGT